MKFRATPFALLLALAAAAPAETLDLDQVVRLASDNAWSMREADVSARQARSDLAVARAQRGLSLTADAGHRASQHPFVRRDVSQVTSVGLNASLPLYTGGSVSAKIERSEALAAKSEASKEESRRAVAAEAVSLYLSFFEWTDEISWREQSVEACDSSLSRTRALFEAGRALESDTLLAASDCAGERDALVSARDASGEILRSLRRLTGLEPSAELVLAPVDTAEIDRIELPESLEELIREIEAGSPQAKADSLQLAAAQASLRAAGARVQVNLSASASTGIDWTPDDYGEELENQYVHSVSLGITIPLLDRGSIAGSVESARLAREQALISRERNARELRDDVETLWRALRLDLAKKPSADLSLRAAEQSYLRAQEKQKLGELSYSDLLQEKTSFDSARLSRQRLRWSLLENSIRLRILRGAYGR